MSELSQESPTTVKQEEVEEPKQVNLLDIPVTDENSALNVLVGFLGLAGVQRFVVDQIGMGILYLLTGGLCFIGTIIDMVNYKKLAFEYNMVQAQQIQSVIR